MDFFLIETMSALEEVEAAVEGIRAAPSLPIAVTMTFDTHFRTMMGVKPVQAVKALYDMGIRVIGANCGNGPGEIERVIGEMVAVKPADVFLIAQSNAGLPKYDPRQEDPLRRHARGDGRVRAEDEGAGHQLHRRVLRLDAGAYRGDERRVERG